MKEQNSPLRTNIKYMEQAEVLLSNLLALKHQEEDRFTIPFDDVIVTIETAVHLLILDE
ncbi:hypothetical protein [Alteromonas sp. MmMcT2-5]|uniref:hypothetical protein n=1 Tax=Alteromonas sp. MmMcT2-5 TaxID=2917733 RepID=UPI001EF29EBC|nr:hypothetical protein [Alteromonas sp. MmMcT2-5]MCG7650989.1 hypothetical protein [Alteromonas sp. MmMcT2-5]